MKASQTVPLLSLLTLFLLSFSIQADEASKTEKEKRKEELLQRLRDKYPNYTVYQIDGKFRRFVEDRKKHLIITEECGTDVEKTSKCDAMKSLSKASTKLMSKKDRLGGKDPGSVLCKKYLSGKLIFARDKYQNSISVCKFSDGSMVETGSIAYYGRKNAKN